MKTPGKPAITTKVVTVSVHSRSSKNDYLAVEEPLEIRLGYTDQKRGRIHRSISITMRTPGDDKNLTAGFLYGENIIQSPEQIKSIDNTKENVIRIELVDDLSFDLSRLDRHFYTTSSCGVCGKASLEALSIAGAEVNIDNSFKVSAEVLLLLSNSLRERQALFAKTGGNHATASFKASGELLRVTEDVGRHNAMDKLIGSMLMDNSLPIHEIGLMVSGRSSFELMQKALMANCPMLVAVGAPSSLAVELAQEYNITLVGFLNEKSFNVYHGEQNII